PNEGQFIVQPNTPVQRFSCVPREGSASSSLEDFSPIDTRRLRSRPPVALEVEEIREHNEERRPETSFADQSNPITPSAHQRVTEHENYRKPKQNKKRARIDSVSSDEFGYTETDSEREFSEEKGDKYKQKDSPDKDSPHFRNPEEGNTEEIKRKDDKEAMDRELIETLGRIAQRLGTKDINIAKFYGYDREDIDQWLDEFDYHLQARDISPASKTALTQLTIHIAGPAQEYIRALPAEQRATLEAVKEALKRCYSRRNREWVQRQKIAQRRQRSGEPLGDYVSDMVSKLNKLDIQENTRVYHFIEGLKPELQMEVLKSKPQTLSEAIETAKEFDALLVRANKSATSESTSEQGLLNKIGDLFGKLAGNMETKESNPKPPEKEHPVVSRIESLLAKAENTATRQTQDTAIAAYSAENQESRILRKEMKELQESLLSLKQDLDPRVIGNSTDVSISRVPTNRPAAVAALNDTFSGNTVNTNGMRDEIQQLKDMIKELGREVYARIPVLTETEPYGNSNSIATFSETNRSGAPEFTEEIRRMERSFTNKLESLYQRVDNRINSHRSRISCPELLGSRERHRHSKPVCYKCGRVGHIQYNCYYNYQPEVPYQNKEEKQDYCADYNKDENPQQDELQNPARLLALDAQYARHVQDYHHKPESPRSDAQTSRQPVRTYSLTFEGEENSSDQLIAALPKQENTNSQEAAVNIPSINPKVKSAVTNEQQSQLMPKQGQSHKRTRRETNSSVQPSNVLLLRGKDVNLKSSDLTTAGKIAGQAVQLLVDTGACVSAIDQQFFTKIYGQFPPKLSDGSLLSVQTFNGDTVPVLGKITVPLQLNGHKYSCEFHVMQSLAYEAILGRDFLQKNGALINLVDSTICFSTATRPGKHTITTTIPVMGTFLVQQNKLKEKTTVATQVVPVHFQKSIQPNCKLAHRSQKNKGIGFQQPLLLLMLVVLYLLTASCTPHTKDTAKPVVQKMPKFVQKAPVNKIQDGRVRVFCIQVSQVYRRDKDPDSEINPHEREPQRIKVLTSTKPFKETDLNNQESPLTVHQELPEDEKRDFFDDISA
ncbi:hypothetical protein ACROYT_G044337, partial [Oculina patagonica]